MKKIILLTLFSVFTVLAAMAQVTVKGVVYEPSGEAAIGATVVEKGKPANGTTTDLDGHFTLKVPSTQSTLVISYIGMKTQDVKLQGKTNIVVHLTSDTKALDEVVIVGYGTQKKINATGAVKTIDNSVLESRPISNAVQGLQGSIAGLNITNDNGGGLGQPMNINIRGVGSIGDGSNASPLVLIDGMEGDLSTINPNDIQNISVLKDAAAASIYGSRAPFGVILVTTKGGTKETRLTYTGNVRFQQPIKVPHPVDGYTFGLMMNDAYINSGGNPPFGSWLLGKIKQFQNGEIEYGTESWPGLDKWRSGQGAFGDTDWYAIYLKKHTTSQEHNVSLTGGGDRITYYLSANYLGQTGLFNYSNEKFQRFSINGKFNIKINKHVQLMWNTRLVSTDNDKPSALNALFYHNLGRMSPNAPLFTPLGEYSDDSLIPAMSDGGRVVAKTQQLYNQANFTITPLKNWQIHIDLSSRIEHNPYTRQFKPISHLLPSGKSEFMKVLNGVNDKHSIRENGTFAVQPAAGESYFEKANNSVNYFSSNVYTDYKLDIAKNHHFKFLLGEQSEYFKTVTDRMASYNILLPETPFIPSEVGGPTNMVSEKKGEWTSLGFFGRINYNFADRYMVELNLRADGASRFPSNQRWATFPSVSVGYNIAQENFWEKLRDKGFEYLKIRGSYGVLGNQNTTSFYPYYQMMASTSGELILGGAQATLLPMYNPFSSSLTWEKIENAGVGIDWGFFNNRLSGSFDWYQRTTKDMVGPAKALSAVYGAKAPKTNNAELRTRGWELEAAWRDRPNKNFSYGISLSLSNYSTIITKYDSPDNALTGWYQGKTYGDIWGYKVLGIAKSDKEMNEYLQHHSQSSLGKNWGGGDLMYADLDNSGAVDAGSNTLNDHGDLTLIGNATPKYAYSVTLEAKWKWIDFRAFFQGVGRRDVFFNNSATFFGISSEWQRSLYYDHLDYFRFAGSPLGANFDSYYGRLRIDGNNIKVSDRFLQNAGYLRLKNVQIGFSLPNNKKIKKYINKARLYISGENLLTFTKLRIYDPEAVGGTDSEYGPGKTYPQYRTYSCGLELTF